MTIFDWYLIIVDAVLLVLLSMCLLARDLRSRIKPVVFIIFLAVLGLILYRVGG